MASSRLEKIGTIYTRLTGLLRSGALKVEDTPIWYNVYKAFPPKYEPKFDRPAPNIPVKNIFYPEDEARAWFHKQNKHLGTTDMSNYQTETATQKFIAILKKHLEDAANSGLQREQLYQSAMDTMNVEGLLPQEKSPRSEKEDKNINQESVAFSFQEAKKLTEKSNKDSAVNLKDIFKE